MRLLLCISSTFLLQACTFDLSISSKVQKPTNIVLTEDLWINSISQNSFTLTGTCAANIKQFTFESPFASTVQCLNNSWSYTGDFSSYPDGILELTVDQIDPNTEKKQILNLPKDTIPPNLTSLKLNNERNYTNSLSVPFILTGSDIAESLVTESAACAGSSIWTATSKGTTVLSTGEGQKTVYAKAKDLAGNESTCVSANIELDQTPPTIHGLSNDSILAGSKTWSWTCTDQNAPCLFRYQISQNPSAVPASSFSNVTTAQTSGDGTYYLIVEAEDQAGNRSSLARVSALLSSKIPAIKIQNGLSHYNNFTTQLHLTNIGDYNVVELSEEANCQNPITQNSQSTLSWTFSAGEGSKELFYRFLNTSTSSSTACYSTSIILDVTKPTISLASPLAPHTNLNTIPVTVTLSEPLPAFNASKIILENATLSSFAGSGTSFTFTLHPLLQGPVKASVAAGSLLDSASNGNTASNILEINYDTTAPILTLSSPSKLTGNSTTEFIWDLTFTGADIVDFDNSYVTLTGTLQGCTSTVTGSGILSRQITVKNCSGNGNVQLSINEGAARDFSDNRSTVMDSASTVTIDNEAPTIALTRLSSATGTSKNVLKWQLTYGGADLITLSEADILLSGATEGCQASISGSDKITRTISLVNCTETGDLFVEIAANTAQDNATNLAPAPATTSSINLTNPIAVGFNESSSIVAEGNGSNTQHFTLNLSKARTYPLTVSYSLIPEFTTTNSHTLPSSGSVTIPTGETSAKIEYTYHGDASSFGSKSIQIAISAVDNNDVQVSNQITRRLIREDDGAPKSAVNISSNYDHSCVVLQNGQLKCWGNNDYGQLGIGNTSSQDSPQLVTGSYSQVATGGSFTCAITTTGHLSCWGSDNSEMLGNGSGDMPATSPPAPIASNFVQISAGERFACGINNQNQLYCWGDNYYGQLGNDGSPYSYLDVPTKIADDFIFVSVGQEYACGIKMNKDLYCWGRNNEGQLGLGDKLDRRIPTLVGSSYIHVAAKKHHSCGIREESKELLCWGNGGYGQLGVGNNNNSLLPVKVGTNFTAVSVNWSTSCALKESGALVCWGSGSDNNLSNITSGATNTPLRIDSKEYSALSVGFATNCAIEKSGMLFCWGASSANLGTGRPNYPTIANAMAINMSFEDIIGSSYPKCAKIAFSNEYYCWSYNDPYGTVGDGSSTEKYAPLRLPLQFESVANNSDRTTCGITPTKDLYCWGDNFFAQFGVSSAVINRAYKPYFIKSNISKVAVGSTEVCYIDTTKQLFCSGGYSYSKHVLMGSDFANVYMGYNGGRCATKSTGELYCWDSPTSSVNKVTGADGLKDLSFGYQFTCGIRNADSKLICWGSNSSGQLGTGDSLDVATPTVITPSYSYKSVAGTSSQMCAVRTDGRLICWGSQYNGENSMDLGSGFNKVLISSSSSCAIDTSNKLKCWGSDFAGGLGRGLLTTAPNPIALD